MWLSVHRDEDMQSLASLMSMKQSDIGNLEDFNDSDDDVGEDRRASFVTGHATPVTGKGGDTLEDHWGFQTKLTCDSSLRRNSHLRFWLTAIAV